MTTELKNVIDILTIKIQAIKELHTQVLKENVELKEEISKLSAHIEQKDKENEEFS